MQPPSPNIDDALPSNLSFHYLRRLVNLPDRWIIVVVLSNQLPDDVCAGLIDVVVQRFSATIALNDAYHFSPRALARALTHELLELAMYQMWTVFSDALTSVSDVGRRAELEQQMRRERDRQIDQRLAAMPFWTPYDIPIPKAAVHAYESS